MLAFRRDTRVFLIRLAARFPGCKRCPGCGFLCELFYIRPILAKHALELPFLRQRAERGNVFARAEGFIVLRWQAFEKEDGDVGGGGFGTCLIVEYVPHLKELHWRDYDDRLAEKIVPYLVYDATWER